jgi:hypothetical protein
MSDNWNSKVECCGNCAFWPLGNYQHDWAGAEPFGIGGHHTDGSVSECRRHAPRDLNRDRYPGATRLFPMTEKRDFCGDFELRG